MRRDPEISAALDYLYALAAERGAVVLRRADSRDMTTGEATLTALLQWSDAPSGDAPGARWSLALERCADGWTGHAELPGASAPVNAPAHLFRSAEVLVHLFNLAAGASPSWNRTSR